MAETHVYAPNRNAFLVPVECAFHAVVEPTVDGDDAFVENVAIAHESEVIASVGESHVIDAIRTLEGYIEVMALLWLKVRISNNHVTHVAHVEMHVHLFQRGSTETTGIVRTEGHPRKLIHNGKSLGKRLLR